MDGNVDDIAGHLAILLQAHVQIFAWKLDLVEDVFHFGRPDLHQRVDVWHGAAVTNARRLLVLVNLSHGVDPCYDLLRILIGVFDGVDLVVLPTAVLLAVNIQSNGDCCLVGLIQ